MNVAIAGDLFFELLVEARFEFADFAAAETRDMNVIAWAVGFVVVAIAAKMEKIEFIDEALALEEIDGAVNGDEVDFRINFLGALEDLVDVEMLLGGIHDLKNDATLAGDTNAALAQGGLEMAGGLGRVDAFSGGDASSWRGGHGASPRWVV